VIPTYNNGRFLTEAIESALAQTVPPREIIVVDDGSTDDTRERLHPYSTLVTYRFQPNQGVSAARNLGMRQASGEFVAFLDSDDVWHPRKLELQLATFQQWPELGMLGTGAVDWPDQPFPEIASGLLNGLRLVTWPQLVLKNRFVTSSVMVRSDILRSAGDFDVSVKSSEERDLWLQIAERATAANLDLLLLGYRSVPGSLSKQPRISQAGMMSTLRKLDHRGAWKGRFWLRRKSYGYMCHAYAFVCMDNKLYFESLLNLLKSFAWYPLPFQRDEVRTRLERPKRLIIAALGILRLRGNVAGRLEASAPRGNGLVDGGRLAAASTSSTANQP